MLIGLNLPNYGALGTRDSVTTIAQRAEELGYASLWTSDHVLLPTDQPEPFGHLLETFMTLAYLAARTDHIRLATGVLVLPQRDPVLPPHTLRRRPARVPRRPHRHHRRTVLPPTRHPTPHRRRRGNSPAARRRAAALADGWHGIDLTPEQVQPVVAALREKASRATFAISLRTPVRIGNVPDRLVAPSLHGNRDAITQQLASYAAAGVDHLVLEPTADSIDDFLDQMTRISSAT